MQSKKLIKTITSTIIKDLNAILLNTEEEFNGHVNYLPGIMVHMAQSKVNNFLNEIGLNNIFIMVDCDSNSKLSLTILEE